MAEVVQAKCPGCSSTLRIPRDWLAHEVRCTRCRAVVRAKSVPTSVTSDTPIPAARNLPPLPDGATKTAIPLATPVGPARRGDSSFDFDGGPALPTNDDNDRPFRRRRRGGSWLGLATFGVLLLGLGGAAFAFKDRIRDAINGKGVVASNDDGEGGEGKGGEAKVGKDKKKPVTGATLFPRRALIVGVHNYLYANPLVEAAGEAPNTERLIRSLNNGLRIPLEQIAHLGDAAKKSPVSPLKNVILEGIGDFLKTCRAQDRVMLFFIGHAVEIEGAGYLVPLEGELENASTLVPLAEIFKMLADCPARQKVFVFDGNRYNAGQGEERPLPGPMSKKMAELLSAPPAGVQVWASCSAEQQSHEFEESSLGLFLDSIRTALTPEKEQKGALEGKIQKHDDLIPVDVIHARVVARMKDESEKRKITQVPILAGSAPAEGASFDPSDDPAKKPTLPVVKATDVRAVQEILNDIGLPSIKGGESGSQDVSFSILPPFPEEKLKSYAGGVLPADSKLRTTIRETRLLLWAISGAKPPADLEADVKEAKGKLGDLSAVMVDRYSKPGEGPAENAFKARVGEDSRAMSKIVARLETALDKLKELGEGDEMENAPPRWKANYKLLLARTQSQLAYLEEYQGLLGSMRKEFPPLDPATQNAWRMSSKKKTEDGAAKKYMKAAEKLYKEVAKDNAGTPWEVLAKRDMLTALGLEWKAN